MNDPLLQDVEAVSRIDAVQKILDVVCRITGMGFSAVARVTEDRWVACAVKDDVQLGLKPGAELPIEATICNEIRASGKLVAFDNAAVDGIFCSHPVPKLYGFQSYLSVPIYRHNGEFFGTLCALDREPAVVNRTETIEMFRLFADLIAMHLDYQDRIAVSENALKLEQETAQFREQFMAVLSHDLRNPLAAIRGAVDVLQLSPREDGEAELLRIVQRSVTRMTGLMDNVLDFARGRLGGGISLHRLPDADIDTCIQQVVDELSTVWPDRRLTTEIQLNRPVACDAPRLGQMLSNLVGNALVHGDPSRPVRVIARSDENGLTISVINHGRPIPADVLPKLFQPFARGGDGRDREGLGLGLFIASEIATAHGGRLSVDSTEDDTRFTFTLPA